MDWRTTLDQQIRNIIESNGSIYLQKGDQGDYTKRPHSTLGYRPPAPEALLWAI